jgi:serine/threonine protein kinase
MGPRNDQESVPIPRRLDSRDGYRCAPILAEACRDDSKRCAEIDTFVMQEISERPILAPVAVETQTGRIVDDEHGCGGTPALDVVESVILEAIATPRFPLPGRSTLSTPGATPQAPQAAPGDRECGFPHASERDDDNCDQRAIGQQIGAYQIAAWIGAGAIGSTYRAIELHGCAPAVALKLVKSAIDSEEVRRRFDTEAHVMTALNKHPNITAPKDVGTTDDGNAYLVMEYVNGRRIDEHCDSRRLDIPARLRLFGQVCEAVQFAHQHALIHGHLKPSNILVTADGVPKIVGFGIARLVPPKFEINSDCTVGRSPFALVNRANLVLTSEFMSPEQVTGETVTTATDIYALGVVLYQLIAGFGPYRIRSRALPDVLQAICEQVPAKPSDAVAGSVGTRRSLLLVPAPARIPVLSRCPSSESALPPAMPSHPTSNEIAAARGCNPERLRRILAGDLDSITLMALRKEPARRYASAELFAEDIRRYLECLPVRANDDSFARRACKLLRRHLVTVAAGMILVLALVVGIVGTTSALALARRERARVSDSLVKALQRVDQLFSRMSADKTLRQPGFQALRTALLQDAKRFYEQWLEEHGADLALRAEAAGAHARLAKITDQIGSASDAISEYQQAIGLWEKLLSEQPSDLQLRANLARAVSELGGVLAPLPGRSDDALRMLCRAQKLTEALVSAKPDAACQRQALGSILLNIAQLQQHQGKRAEAVDTLARVVDIESRLAAEDPSSLDPRICLADAHTVLGQAYAGQPDELLRALTCYRQAIHSFESIIAERPELADEAYRLAAALSNLSILQQMARQPDASLASLHRSSEILDRLGRLYPGVLSYQDSLATVLNMTSDLLRNRGETVEALTVARHANALFERLSSKLPSEIRFELGLAKSHNNLGRILQQAGESAAALRSFQRAIDLYESLSDSGPQNSYSLACNLSLAIPLVGTSDRAKHSAGITPKFSAEIQRRRRVFGNRAMAALRRAVSGGFLTGDNLQSEADLASLRDRSDFQMLMQELAKESATFDTRP